MPDSSIIADGLVARPGVQQVKLEWEIEDVAGPDYLTLDAVEVWSGTTNDRAFASKVGEGRTDFTHSGLPEEVTRYYWIRPRTKAIGASGERYYGAWQPVSGTAGVTGKAIGMAGLAFSLANGQLAASVSGGALTVAIKNTAGDDPSASAPVFAATPSPSVSAGGYAIRTIEAALSNTIGSGSTLGVVANEPFALWVVLADVSGTPRLGVINPLGPYSDSSGAAALDESLSAGISNGALGSAGDSADIIYAPVTAASPSPLRIIGSLTWDSGLVTPGTWVAPSRVQLFARGSRPPGAVLKVSTFADAAVTTVTATIPNDNTIPQVTEGASVSLAGLKGVSPANFVIIDVEVQVSVDVSDNIIATLSRFGASGDVIKAASVNLTAGKMNQINLRAVARIGDYSRVYDLRLGAVTGGTTITVNGAAAARLLGGLLSTSWKMTEIVG